MSLVITEPIKTVNGLLTKALAARSQVRYTMQREDFSVTNTGLGAGNLVRVVIADTSTFTAGDTVYLKTDIFDQLTTIVTVAGATLLDVNINYVMVGGAGYINNYTTRPQYRIAVDVRDAADTFTLFGRTFRYVTNQAGFLEMDLFNVLSTYMGVNGLFSQEYFLRVTEEWTGSSETPVDTTILQAIYGNKQILSVGGANMWEYLLRETGSSTDGSLGKLLTLFEKPKVWRGWNRTAAFLADADIAVRNTNGVVRFTTWDTDINKVLINSSVVFSYQNTNLNPDVYIRNIFVDLPIVAAAQFRAVRLDGVTEGVPIADTIYYKVEDECPQPIMLDWINSVGGIEQHLFSIGQAVEYNAGAGVVVESPITEDIEFVARTKRRFIEASVQTITLLDEGLTFDQVVALNELKNTESLRVYLSKDGSSFVDAIVTNIFATVVNTKLRLFDFAVSIEFPDDFDFYNAKEY